ncbi:hypothetical protein L1280_001526 [Deinococcus sp. HSC-46F16]|uniref:hypothetical protein n=1 Tax=Deinococcus sp. HSC-46F16 TaxID=2910968 RepID=UPI0020A204B7|nr:hypothetical protein [Deinococcus sp. HSC-46F16]MCP2014389.1 hypothetical protein [Deinococcus sp. HSC-46F16]
MSDQQSLFETVLVPAGEKPSAAPSAPDLVHLAEGWRATLQDLDGPGRRWLVTPWLTTRHADLLGSVQRGDRLLIRGHAEDFLKGMSSLDAVQAFMEWGVEVRRLPNLHAKVYAREHEGGVLWLGSANLSKLGEDGGAHSRQVEAMSGPHPLTPAALTKLEYLWSTSRPFNPSDVQHELTRLVQEQEAFRELLLDQAELGVLALRLSFKLLGGQFTMPPDWLGHGNEQAQRDRVRYPSVEFIDPDTSLATRFRKFISAERRKLGDRMVDVPGISGLYVLRAEDMLSIKTFLGYMERQARQRFEQELHQEREHLRSDFTTRFESAFQRFLSEQTRHMAKTPAQAAKDAAEVFDDYLGRDPFRISAQFFIPLKDADDPHGGLSQAMSQVRARQRLY